MKKFRVITVCLILLFTVFGGFFNINNGFEIRKASAGSFTQKNPTQSEPLIPLPKVGNPHDNVTYSAAGYGTMPCVGNPKIIVVLISFPDDNTGSFINSDLDIEDFFFEDSGKSNPTHQLDSLRGFYYRSSYGKLDITGTIIKYTAQYNYGADEYKTVGGVIDDRQFLFREAMDNINWGVEIDDWDSYDVNNDGYIDGLVFATMRATPHRGGYYSNSLSYTLGNGKKTFPFIYTPGLATRSRIQSVCTIAHEIFHLMGLGDFYFHMGLNREGTGASSIMCSSNVSGDLEVMHNLLGDIPGITKYIFGWINPQHIASASETQVTLSSFSDAPSMAVIHAHNDIGNMNWYVAEYVTKSNNNMNMERPESGGGLRFWHVKMNAGPSGVFDADRTSRTYISRPYDLIETIRPNHTRQQIDYNFFYYPGDTLTPFSTPTNSNYPGTITTENLTPPLGNAVLGDWTDSGIYIEHIEIAGGVASFTVNENTPLVRPSLSQSTFTFNGEAQNVTLNVSDLGYYLGGDVTRTNAGNYTATVTLNEGYAWDAGTSDEILNLPWSIGKAIVSGIPATKTVPEHVAGNYSFDLTALLPAIFLSTAVFSVDSISDANDLISSADITNKLLNFSVNSIAAGKTADITVLIQSVNYEDFSVVLKIESVEGVPEENNGTNDNNLVYYIAAGIAASIFLFSMLLVFTRKRKL